MIFRDCCSIAARGDLDKYLLPSGKGNNAKEEDQLEDDGHVVNGEVG